MNQAWWYMPIILAAGRKEQKDQEFKVILNYQKILGYPGLHEALSLKEKKPRFHQKVSEYSYIVECLPSKVGKTWGFEFFVCFVLFSGFSM